MKNACEALGFGPTERRTIMKFKIGDKVRDTYATESKIGTVVDIMTGKSTEAYVYVVNYGSHENYMKESWLSLVEEPAKYRFTIDIAESVHNVVIATMIEERGGVEKEIARGHGHVIHEGALGIAQAASYALRCIYKGLEGECDA